MRDGIEFGSTPGRASTDAEWVTASPLPSHAPEPPPWIHTRSSGISHRTRIDQRSLDVGVRALAARSELTDLRSAMAATGFPDVAATLTALGVRARPGVVTLDDSAPLVAIRRAIESGAVSDPQKAPIEP